MIKLYFYSILNSNEILAPSIFSNSLLLIGVTISSKFYTIKFKDRVGLGSGSISIHFLTKIYLGP
jgi:hypothetical protein